MRETDLADRGPSDIEWDVSCALRALKCELSAQRVLRSGRRISALLRAKAYDPAQPRDDLGRWALVGTSLPVSVPSEQQGEPPASGQDGRVRVAGAFDWGLVDLREEEGIEKAHTIAEHVGKTDAYLLARVRGESFGFFAVDVIRFRDGSFPSIEAANKLVNSTLARNAAVVEDVAGGRMDEAFVKAEFGSVTGREAFRSSPRAEPYIRETTGVGVKIVHDPSIPRGFYVKTAYPRSE